MSTIHQSMRYHQPDNRQQALATIDHLCRHHDHLKALDREYSFMRQEETYERMADPTFQTDPAAMDQVDSRAWLRTSLVVKLSAEPLKELFADASVVYAKTTALIRRYDPSCEVDIYFDSAHTTIKTIVGDVARNAADLERYATIIRPIVQRWIAIMETESQLYAVGLFSSLSAERGRSLGFRFLPSLLLLQIIRGKVGAALYCHADHLQLRPETTFHTMLTHSTNLSARLCNFPLHRDFINAVRSLLETHDHHIFGVIDRLTPADFVIRHGYSDQMVPLVEVGCG